MKSIFPILLIVGAIGLFIAITNPQYQIVKDTQIQVDSLTEALSKSNLIISKRTELQKQYNSFGKGDIASIDKLLPDNVDNVQLVLDMNGIARNHGMVLRNIKIQDQGGGSASSQGTQTLGPNNNPVGSLVLSFDITGDYQSFTGFLKDLEQSLRIVDVTGISFKSTDKGVYDYVVNVKTYWLK
ncbi:MAG: hypothetical protein WCF92_01080 [bacterium]